MTEDFYNWQEAHWDYLERSYPLDYQFSLLTFDEYCLREYGKVSDEQRILPTNI